MKRLADINLMVPAESSTVLQPLSSQVAASETTGQKVRKGAENTPRYDCAGCGASNASTARFCRHCGSELGLEQASQERLAGLHLAELDFSQTPRKISIASQPQYRITALAYGWGYYAFTSPGWGIGLVGCTAPNAPGAIDQFKLEQNDRLTTISPVIQRDLIPGFFAIGVKTVHRLQLVPRPYCQCVFELLEPGWSIDDAVMSGNILIVRLIHPATWWYRWVAIDDTSGESVMLPYQQSGPASSMIATGSHRFFFHTAKAAYEYNFSEHRETAYPAPARGWNTLIAPELNQRNCNIILGGNDGLLYRLAAKNQTAVPALFSTVHRDIVHLVMPDNDEAIYVFGRHNAFVLDHESGDELWNFHRQLGETLNYGSQRPLCIGDMWMLSCRELPQPGERVTLLATGRSPKISLLPAEIAVSPMPVFGDANLMCVQKPSAGKPEEPALLLYQF